MGNHAKPTSDVQRYYDMLIEAVGAADACDRDTAFMLMQDAWEQYFCDTRDDSAAKLHYTEQALKVYDLCGDLQMAMLLSQIGVTNVRARRARRRHATV